MLKYLCLFEYSDVEFTKFQNVDRPALPYYTIGVTASTIYLRYTPFIMWHKIDKIISVLRN